MLLVAALMFAHCRRHFPRLRERGTEYGLIFSVLGGDDAGGGVAWAPLVIREAQQHGVVLGKNGRLYDPKRGERLPAGVAALAADGPVAVIDTTGLIRDRPGFRLLFAGRESLPAERAASDRYRVAIVHRGHWRLSHAEGETVLFLVEPTQDAPGATRGFAASGDQ